MRSWKRMYRARRREEQTKWMNSESDNFSPKLRSVRRRTRRSNMETYKHISYGIAQFEKSPFYESCTYHICMAEEITASADYMDIQGISCVDGSGDSCSYMHCGVVHFTPEEAEERVNYIDEHGWDAYFLHYYNYVKGDGKDEV